MGLVLISQLNFADTSI